MPLDPRFVVTSDLESYFVDRDSGAPLAGGIVTFYRQTNQSTKKPVYQISVSSNGIYSYAALPNPCILSDVGTFQDALGNNIVPYYFPFQGSPVSGGSNGQQDLYHITVESSTGVPQFTRDGWPNNGDSSSNSNVTNFVSNSQFLAHNDIGGTNHPPVEVVTFGSTTLNSTIIAQGGWSFRLSAGSTSVFNNVFFTFPSSVSGLNDFPRYAFEFVCTTFVGADTAVDDLTITWPGANTFSAPTIANSSVAQEYTFYFSASSASNASFDLYIIRNFGTGGTPSTPEQTLVSTFTVTPGFSAYSFNIASFSSTGTLGTDGNDTVSIAIRGKQACDVKFTDFVLLLGEETITSVPVQTQAQTLVNSVIGSMPVPNPDGSSIYLPLVLTAAGITFDDSTIGEIVPVVANASLVTDNKLLCDGSAYKVSDYSTLGIPYRRLFTKLFQTGNNSPKFGTGTAFVSINFIATSGKFLITSNMYGAQTAPAAGTSGFTITKVADGGQGGNGYISHSNNTGFVTAKSIFTGTTNGGAAFATGTSTMQVSKYHNSALNGTFKGAIIQALQATSLSNAGGAGLYFTFSGTGTNYYVWFHLTNETDPAPGGVGIEIFMQSALTAGNMGNVIATTLMGGYSHTVQATSGSVTPQSSYWQFTANSITYTVWYNINGAGTAPAFTNLIEVDILTADSATIVGNKTQVAIQSTYFAVPDYRGMVLMGADVSVGAPIWDADIASRFGYINTQNPADIGSFQMDGNTLSVGGATGAGGAQDATDVMNVGGGTQRPANSYVNFYIKY